MRTKAAVTAVARRCSSVSEGTAAGRRGHAKQGKPFVDARRWAQQQPGLAREVLAVPPPPHGPQSVNAPPASAPSASSLESYLKLRQWDMTVVSPEDRGVAMSLISHPLTFPLTLGMHMSTLRIGSERQRPTITCSRNRSRSSTLRLCCVGARAEATLPDEYWKELLLSASLSGGFQTMNEDVEASTCTSTTCTIDFIGPDVSPHLQSKTVVLDVPWARKHTLEMNFHKCYLHQYIAERYKVSKNSVSAAAKDRSAALHDRSFDPASQPSLWDGYVLFNPGIGHPNLAKGWIPTLRYVINTRRPVLITAHSRLDTERDWSVLKATLLDLGQDERLQRCCGHSDDDGEQNPYRLNPFASRLDYEDPCCEAAGLHLGNGKEDGSNHMYVRPNMFSLLLH